MKRVLIVDDSAFMRKFLSDLFDNTPDFTVIDVAKNGSEALAKIKTLQPDLVTLDIEMPVMSGLEALEEIMLYNPLPVVVISSLTKEGSEQTIKALCLGAVDFITKDIVSITNFKEVVLSTCRRAGLANLDLLKKKSELQKISLLPLLKPVATEKIVVVGCSTGGPRALQEVIPRLPANLPCGVVVVQHMPPGFTKSLAERLNAIADLKVKEAEDRELVTKGTVYIAPGDFHLLLENTLKGPTLRLSKAPPLNSHRPAATLLFESAAQVYGSNCVGVLLTGMGQDGAKGMSKIKMQNGYNLVESEQTAVVYGMPKAAVELGVVDEVAPLPIIAEKIVKAVS